VGPISLSCGRNVDARGRDETVWRPNLGGLFHLRGQAANGLVEIVSQGIHETVGHEPLAAPRRRATAASRCQVYELTGY
jgi:hypothetical protein